MNFIHLNTRSKASMLYGMSEPSKLVAKAKELGQRAIALTDYSNLYASIPFYKECVEVGLKPILGVDVNFVEDVTQYKKQGLRRTKRLTLIALNNKGWQNITRIVSQSNHRDNFFYNPRVDFDLLELYKDGIAILSGSYEDSIVSSYLIDEKDSSGEVVTEANSFRSEAILRRLSKIVGAENIYIELQNHGKLNKVTEKLRAIAKKYNLKCLATNNVHYINRSDAEAHKTLLAMNANSFNSPTSTRFDSDEYYLKTHEEMRKLGFLDVELQNTQELADRVDLKIDMEKRRLPSYRFIPDGKKSACYLRELTEKGLLAKKLSGASYNERLERELADINEMGFNDYFLIVHDIVSWCRSQSIILGYGRGSVGGSLVAYCLGITNIDPIKYKLVWERFLNKGRGGLPDIDTDVPKSRRKEVLSYIKSRFGEDNVAQIVNYNGLKARAILKEVFRVYDMPFEEANKITALIPKKDEDHTDISLKDALQKVPELREYEKKYKPWFAVASLLEGCYKAIGVHAAAVVISDVPFNESEYPLTRSKDGDLMFGWDMSTVDSLNLLKLDILGLSTLDDIQSTIDLVKNRRGISIDHDNINLNDEAAYAIMSQGLNVGIFQIEKQLGKSWSKKIEPSSIDDISSLISIIRPGPLESGLSDNYVKNKQTGDRTSIHPLLDEVTYDTYGQPIFQEQLIFACQKLAGMNLVEADMVRAAVGKKKPEAMKKWKAAFIDGCSSNSIDSDVAEDIWAKFEKFAGYSFNKSHGVGYGLLAYETAYLKAHYPSEFFCSKLRHADGDFDKIKSYIYDAKLFGIEVVPPSVLFGNLDFDIINDQKIAFGLSALKGVGAAAIKNIVSLTKNAKTSDDLLWSFFGTKKINSSAVLALIKGGAFDSFNEDRVSLLSKYRFLSFMTEKERDTVYNISPEHWREVFKALSDEQESARIKTEYSVKIPNARRRSKIREFLAEEKSYPLFDSRAQKIAWEQHFLGVGLSGSETDVYKAKNKCVDVIKNSQPNRFVDICICVDSTRRIITKKGDPMAFITGRDDSYILESIVVFPKQYDSFKNLLEEGNVLRVSGKIDERGSLIANKISHPI